MPITLENYQYIRSGYSARRDSELPTFSRWLELPLGKPKAEWLCIVCYDKEQDYTIRFYLTSGVINPNKLSVYSYNKDTKKLSLVDATVAYDKENKEATFQSDRSGIYVLMYGDNGNFETEGFDHWGSDYIVELYNQ